MVLVAGGGEMSELILSMLHFKTPPGVGGGLGYLLVFFYGFWGSQVWSPAAFFSFFVGKDNYLVTT